MSTAVFLKPLVAIPRGADERWCSEWTIPVRVSSWDSTRMEGYVDRVDGEYKLLCMLRFDSGSEHVWKLPSPDPKPGDEGVAARYLPSLEACVALMEDMRREWLDELIEADETTGTTA